MLSAVLAKCDPDLLATLGASTEPDVETRERVVEVVADEFNEHVSGPEWEPTARGKRVDDALGRFLHRFPIDR